MTGLNLSDNKKSAQPSEANLPSDIKLIGTVMLGSVYAIEALWERIGNIERYFAKPTLQ